MWGDTAEEHTCGLLNLFMITVPFKKLPQCYDTKKMSLFGKNEGGSSHSLSLSSDFYFSISY